MTSVSFTDLEGKVALLTGGTGIIGKSMARALATAGVKVAIAGRDHAKADSIADALANETGGTVIGLGFDVLDRASLEMAREEIHARLGLVDLLVNAAGGNRPAATTGVETMVSTDPMDLGASFFGLDSEAFDGVFRLNFTGTLLPTQVFAQDMVGRGGVVLNISSMSADRPLTKVGAYSASKSAINNFTQWLAVHLAPQNIRVNALAPGFFLTEQNRFILTNETTGELSPRAHKIVAGTPLGRFGEVEELQGATLFLLSDLSKFVTGIVLPVDGGFSAYSGV